MQVTIGAKCWDGMRRKELRGNAVPVEVWSREVGKRIKYDHKLRAALGGALPLVFVLNGVSTDKVSAAALVVPEGAVKAGDAMPVISGAVKSKILHAFDPLIDLFQSLSYPIAGVMIAAGCLFIMVGNRERGMQMLQNAAIGYILVQLSPMFLQLLVGVGESV